MKRMLLAGVMLAALPVSNAYAAGCTIISTGGNLQWLSCTSDSQANDGDDVKFFDDGTGGGTTITGSLAKNSQAAGQQNVSFTSTGSGFNASTDGNGFANFKSIMDDVNAYTAVPIVPSTIPSTMTPFLGFDGELFRGQLANFAGSSTAWNGDVSVIVHLSDGTTVFHTFTGFTINNDIGVLGFDEVNDPGVFVTSVEAFAGNLDASGNPLTAGEGSWDQYKQIEFSVPGQIASIPEPSTWMTFLLGFGLVGMIARRRGWSSASAS